MTKHEFKEWAISIGIVLGTVKALVLVCLFYSYFPRVFGISLLSLIVLGVLICMVMAVKDIRESGGWQVGAEIAEAVEAAHKKTIVHRDLKTPNIKVTPDGGDEN